MKEHKVDAKGMQCPRPIMEVFKTARKAESGDIIKVEASDAGFPPDIKAWCRKTGHKLVKVSEVNDFYRAVIRVK